MNLQAMLAQALVVGFESPEPDAFLEQLITRHGVGGVILFARNIETPEQVWRLNHELQLMARKSGKLPLFIMVDQEGGSVARLKAPFTHGPDMCALTEASEDELFSHGKQMGEELWAAGFNWNLAPVVDINAGDGIMARRSLGANARRVSRLALAYAQGLMSAGCLACAKHFPGLGRTSLDTHKLGVAVELAIDELEQMEFIPFIDAVATGIPGILVSHATFRALDPDSPASLSAKVVHDLLRLKMGYQKLILTDDLEMGAVGMAPSLAAQKAYVAGNDLLLICRNQQEILPALELLQQAAIDRMAPAAQVEQSHLRIQTTKAKLIVQPPLATLKKVLNI